MNLPVVALHDALPAEARLDTALRAGRLGYWELDSTRRLTSSAQHNANFGYPAAHTPDFADLLAALKPDDRPRYEGALDTALATGEPFDIEVQVNWPDGSQHWLRIGGQRITDEPGRSARIVGISFDITDRRSAENKQKLLMDELNHRVRNTLAIVMAIANQTLRHSNSSAQFRTDFEARVTAMAAAHNLLTASNWEGALLHDMVESVLKPYADNGRQTYKLDGEALRVGPKFAMSLLMAFHELATNAAKHGALSNDAGHIVVTWSLTQPPKARALRIEWREIGGPAVKPRRRRGFGSRLIDGLAAETNGHVSLKFERDGLICTIDVPLPPNGDGVTRAT